MIKERLRDQGHVVNDVKLLEDETKSMPRIQKLRVFKRPTQTDQVSWGQSNALTIYTATQGPSQPPPHLPTNLANASTNTTGESFNDYDTEEEFSEEPRFEDRHIHGSLKYIDERGSYSDSLESRFSEPAVDKDDLSTLFLEGDASVHNENSEKLAASIGKV